MNQLPPVAGPAHLLSGIGSVISPDAELGAGCQIGPHVTVGARARLGRGVRLDSGVHVGADVTIEDDVQIGPNAVVLGGPAAGGSAATTLLQTGVQVGANATIHPGVQIGQHAVVRAGSVVLRSVPATAIVEGNPASISGYVGAEGELPATAAAFAPSRLAPVEPTGVRGVTVHNFPVIPDMRGNLTVGEFERQIPFTPLRYFMVFGVPSKEIRGEHAHIECHQFLICVQGSCAVVADDGTRRVEVLLDSPHRGIYLPPMTWGIQYKYTSDAKLLVFASHHYDAKDYIRDYAAYLARARADDAARVAADGRNRKEQP